VRIPCTTIKELLTSQAFRPTHVKVDIEGAEADAIPAAVEFFREHRPVVFLELHGDIVQSRGRDARAVLTCLSECGYIFKSGDECVSLTDAARANYNLRLVCVPAGQP
jgi:hypothetical protein